ncbi:Sucrose-6F-phosphate phosphohydrolase [Cardiosporidium cionae]|uniref:Sucrose-6F-phosphate phosphohydrolase n=1 Tax=Cardiosporidium cionae TaxID=476202 RepID=A0ABQ7J7V2_9APIC|nr:Sucrose-6F-phosphate phosphohydrolase [Cardiosporidium cionae]|eukprot:KAF8820062.1 Sucrose-6F-phosphate phosphohydrolase [Cardiosporidium cionae]
MAALHHTLQLGRRREMARCGDGRKPGWMRAEFFMKNHLRFVLCNEERKEWDNPPLGQCKQNYEIIRQNDPSNSHSSVLDKSVIQNSSGIASDGYSSIDYTLVEGELSRVEGPAVMLVCDLDGTLIGHSEYLQQFNLLWLKKHAWRNSLLVYNTGRNLKDALLCSQEENLLQPDFLVCGVGTELYHFDAIPSEEYLSLLPLTEEQSDIQAEWKFPWWCPSFQYVRVLFSWREKIAKKFSRDTMESYIEENFPTIRINGTKLYDPWRLSLSVSLHNPEWEKLLLCFNQKDVKLLVSGSGEWRFDFVYDPRIKKFVNKISSSLLLQNRFFDILPPSGGKLHPILFLMERYTFSASQVLLAYLCLTANSLISLLHQNSPPPPHEHVVFSEFPCAGGIIQAMNVFGYGYGSSLSHDYSTLFYI